MSSPRYITIDLVIRSKADLTPLVEGLEDGIAVLFNGERTDYFEAILNGPGMYESPNEELLFWCAWLDSLQGVRLELWKGALSREFDLGFESGKEGQCVYEAIEPSVIKHLSEFESALGITVYPAVLPQHK